MGVDRVEERSKNWKHANSEVEEIRRKKQIRLRNSP